MDEVFKALADPTRRSLLDELFKEDGQTLRALEQRLPMTRFGVMKHLRVLEDANLVVSRRQGREKLHYLNPVPIRLVHDRWVSKYAEPWAARLSDLKKTIEESDQPRPEVQPLDILAGAWRIEALFPNQPPGQGRATFEWASGGAFLVQRVELLVDRSLVPQEVAPDSITIIGAAAGGGGYVQHYFDARGVARVYLMTLDAQTWSLTRTTADFTPLEFSQRYTGRISDDGRTITGSWERASRNGDWQLDFDLIYRR